MDVEGGKKNMHVFTLLLSFNSVYNKITRSKKETEKQVIILYLFFLRYLY